MGVHGPWFMWVFLGILSFLVLTLVLPCSGCIQRALYCEDLLLFSHVFHFLLVFPEFFTSLMYLFKNKTKQNQTTQNPKNHCKQVKIAAHPLKGVAKMLTVVGRWELHSASFSLYVLVGNVIQH